MAAMMTSACALVLLASAIRAAGACTHQCYCHSNYHLGKDAEYFESDGLSDRYSYRYHHYKYYTADCSSSKLTALPLGLHSNVVILDVSYNKIDSLPENAFSYLGTTQLNIIYLNNNTIATIHADAFKNLSSLRKLVLDNNRITILPLDVFESCPRLQYLSLSGNDLHKISDNVLFKSLGYLRSLHLARCNLSFLPHQIYDLSLNMLDISDNRIDNIDVTRFKYVRELRAENNLKISFHNDQQKKEFKLTSLNLNGNTLTIPNVNFSFNASYLEELRLVSCNLSSWPLEVFKQSKDIQLLELQNNNIRKVDTSMLKQLSVVRLDNNSIQSISPNAFLNNTKLKNLFLGGNPLSIPKNGIFLNATITELSLAYCKLDKITRLTFKGTPLLEIVDLGYNALKNIDNETFHGLRYLKRLLLNENQITTIHQDAFITNRNLSEIILRGNQLILPQEGSFLNAANLRVLDISSCKIETLPISIFKNTPYLWQINFGNNSLQRLDVKAFEKLSKLYFLEMSGNPLLCDFQLKQIWIWCMTTYVTSNATCVKPKGNWRMLEHLHLEQNSKELRVTSPNTPSLSASTTSASTAAVHPSSLSTSQQPEVESNASPADQHVQHSSETLSKSLLYGLLAVGCIIGIGVGVALDFAIARYFTCVRFTHGQEHDTLIS